MNPTFTNIPVKPNIRIIFFTCVTEYPDINTAFNIFISNPNAKNLIINDNNWLKFYKSNSSDEFEKIANNISEEYCNYEQLCNNDIFNFRHDKPFIALLNNLNMPKIIYKISEFSKNKVLEVVENKVLEVVEKETTTKIKKIAKIKKIKKITKIKKIKKTNTKTIMQSITKTKFKIKHY